MQPDYKVILRNYIGHVRRSAGDDFIDNLSVADRKILFELSPRVSHLGPAIESGNKPSWFSGMFSR